MLKTSSSIHAVVSIKDRLVTDGRTDRQTDGHDESIYGASIASRGTHTHTPV